MSKIVILSTELGAPQIVNDLLVKLAIANPALADWVRQFDSKPLILECVKNTLSVLGKEKGIILSEGIIDYCGNLQNDYDGQQLIGSLETVEILNGMGVFVNNQGVINFVVNDHESSLEEEIDRLQGLFQDAFLSEVTNSILQIMGYNTRVTVSVTDSGEKVYSVEAVKGESGFENDDSYWQRALSSIKGFFGR